MSLKYLGYLQLYTNKPITILVALEGTSESYDDCITKHGLLPPLSLSDGTAYYQACFYCANMVETIISPAAVLVSSDVFYSWTQEGFKDPTLPGSLRFTSHDGLLSMYFPLQCRDVLYYCDTDNYTVTVTLSAYSATEPLCIVPIPSSSQLPRHDRSNPRSGLCALVPLVNTSWTSFPATLTAPLHASNIICSAASI